MIYLTKSKGKEMASNDTRNVNFANDTVEMVYNDYKPYLMMLTGAGSVFGFVVLMRLFMWVNMYFFNNAPATDFWTWGLAIAGFIACVFVYKFYKRRGEQGNEVLIRFHPTVSTALGVGWMIIAFNDQPNEWMFSQVSLGLFILGGILIAFTWMARRWSFKQFQPVETEPIISDWETFGMGMTSNSQAESVPGGKKYKVKLDPKMSFEDFMTKAPFVAKKFKTSAKKVRIQEDPTNPEYAYTTVFEKEPFEDSVTWTGPDKPGTSIGEPISFATYDISERADIFLSGKNGSSCHHWLTVGMSGSGKTYAWQGIYASVLNRREVSLVYLDASKGAASMMPLASGIEWFAGTMEDAVDVIDGIERAIKARQNYLIEQGLAYWKPGCGINFIIFHVEEAADFIGVKEVEGKLKHIARAARSAGIAVVYSLQRATNDNVPVTLREQLEGRMTFKVGNKKENPIALAATSIGAGAAPQSISVKGGFYMTSPNTDDYFAGNILRVDAFDERDLERAVDLGSANRTPLDGLTARAFGEAYENYRMQVMNGTTEWQRIRMNRDMKNESMKTSYESPTAEYEKYENPEMKNSYTSEGMKSKRSQNFTSDKESEKAKLWDFIISMKSVNEEFTFSEIQKPYTEQYGVAKSTVYKRMQEWLDEDKLGMNGKMYFIK